MADDQEERIQRIFAHFDADKSGSISTGELQQILQKMGIELDKENTLVLVKRYDDDNSGTLSYEEFSEMIRVVIRMKRQYEEADEDKSGTINAKELLKLVEKLGLKVSPSSIGPVVQLFDEDGSGTVNYQEYFALMFYFQELEYQYENYKGDVKDYSWLTPLLGIDNMHKIPTVAQKLQQMKSKKLPTFDEFVQFIVKEAIDGNKDPTGRRKKLAPRLVIARNREKVKAPKRGIVFSTKRQAHPNPVAAVRTQLTNLNTKDLFVDNEFVCGPAVLPPQTRQKVFNWKRTKEINPNAQLFVSGVDEGDVIQGALGDCWFLGALSVVATCTDNFIEHLFINYKPEIGYYQIRYYKNGQWQHVEVDDRLPCGHSGRLYFASCKDPTEFWVPIVEKAYAKLHGSYDALEMGNIADGLKDLTGEAVEVMLLDDKAFMSHFPNLWKTLTHYIKESFVMGCSFEDPKAATEHEQACGLLLNHAYSIIDCQEVQGFKLVRVRNPWGRGEWNGPWGDGSKEWTPALLKHFNYDFANDGTFFMIYEDFIKHFNRIYVLRLMTDSEGEVWEKYTFLGEWRGETAGGCTNNSTWSNNPQYGLEIKQGGTKVFMNLSQPDLRYETKMNPGHHGKQYPPIGLVAFKVNDTNYKLTSFKPEQRVSTSLFCGMRDISLEFTAEQGKYIIMPCTYNPKVEMKFELAVYTQSKSTIREVNQTVPRSTCKGAWRGPSAGGCGNHGNTWMNNPQFLLKVNGPGPVTLTLEQSISGAEQPECIGIYVFKSAQPTRLARASNLVVTPSTFLNVVASTETLQAEANVNYIVMPCTFDPFERSFSISASALSSQVTTFSPL